MKNELNKCAFLLSLIPIVLILFSFESIIVFLSPYIYASASNVNATFITPQAGNLSSSGASVSGEDIVIVQTSACPPGDVDEARLTITKTVLDPNDLVSDTREDTLPFTVDVLVRNGNPSTGGRIITEAQPTIICVPEGERYDVVETLTPTDFTFRTTLTGQCDNILVVADADYSCRIENTILTSTRSDGGTLFLEQDEPTQTSPSDIGSRKLITPRSGTSLVPQAADTSTEFRPSGGLNFQAWRIIANGLYGSLFISVDDNGKLNGTIFNHPIINGSWNQVTKKITFTERTTTGLDNKSVFYKYEGFMMGPFCENSPLINPYIIACTEILAGAATPQRYYGAQQFGWLAISLRN
jgi:hypothetical protein